MRCWLCVLLAGPVLCAAAAAAELPDAPGGAPPGRRPLPAPRPAAPEADEEDGHVVVVTTTRLPTAPEETGTVLTVWDEELIRSQGSSEAQDVLRQMPGLNVARLSQPGAPTNLFLRGGESDHALVLLDGFQVNQDGGGFDWDDIGTAGLGRMVLLRGAASALYGSDAMTGVVSMETAKGEGSPRSVLSMGAGNLHAFRERAQVLGAEGNVAYNFSLERYDRTGSRDVNGDYRRAHFAGRVDFEPRDRTALRIITHKSASEFGATELDLAETDPNESNDDEYSLLGVEWTERWKGFFSTAVKAWRWDEENAFDDPPDEGETVRTRRRVQFARTGLDIQGTVHAPETEWVRSSLAAGGVWQGETYDSAYLYQDLDPVFGFEDPSDLEESRHTRALYWTLRATVLDRLDLEGGQRYEDHSTFGSATTSRAAASLRIDETRSRLHASYGTGIKEPTFFENFSPQETFTFTFLGFTTTYISEGNPDLDPERTESFDVGVEQRLFDDRVRLDLTYFHIDFDDFIAWKSVLTASTPTSATFTSTFLNGDAAVSEGWELSGEVRVLDNLRLLGQLTNLETEAETEEDAAPSFVDGKPLLRRPRQRWSLAAAYEPVPRVSLFAGVVTTGEFVDGDWSTGDRVRVDGHTRVDLAASWEFLKGWRLFGRLENALDEEGFEAYDYPVEPIHGLVGIEATMQF